MNIRRSNNVTFKRLFLCTAKNKFADHMFRGSACLSSLCIAIAGYYQGMRWPNVHESCYKSHPYKHRLRLDPLICWNHVYVSNVSDEASGGMQTPLLSLEASSCSIFCFMLQFIRLPNQICVSCLSNFITSHTKMQLIFIRLIFELLGKNNNCMFISYESGTYSQQDFCSLHSYNYLDEISFLV